ncbi:MAG: c-type cytochrome [Marinirhabdus sp.]
MARKILRQLATLPVLLLFVSCSTTTEDDLIDAPVNDDDGGVELVTYQDVGPIFENVCTVCHSNPPQNGAPMSLETYTEVRDAVLNQSLLDRISRPEGAPGAMPLGGPRLPQATINEIIQWNEDGLLEN